jgi:hypothetical protein
VVVMLFILFRVSTQRKPSGRRGEVNADFG